MDIQTELLKQMKQAMKSKDQVALMALRALKAAFILAKTESGVTEELSKEQELKIVQKQVKQRKDSAKLFVDQNRDDLAASELAELKVLQQFMPEALNDTQITEVVKDVIKKLSASGMKDMGKVMGFVSKELVGQADGSKISQIVKNLLS